MARVFVRDSLGLAASQYVARAMVLARGVAAAAALGPAGFGAWNALNLILDYGAYASLGAIQGLELLLPAPAARGDTQAAGRVMRGAWGVTLGGAALFAIAVILVLIQGRWIWSTGWGWGPPAWMLVAAILQLVILYHSASLRGHGDFSNSSIGLALQALVGGGVGIATVWRFGAWGLVIGWVAGGVCAVAWMRRSAARPPLLPAGIKVGMTVVAGGFPIFAFLALVLIIRSLGRIALARYADNQVLGHYGLGLTIEGLILYMPQAAASVLFPRVAAAAQGARDAEETRRQVVNVHRFMMVALPAVAGVGVMIAPWVIRLVLPAFASSMEPLRVLAVAALVMSMATVPSFYLLGSKRTFWMLAIPGFAAIVTAAASFGTAMISPNATAMAWATAAGYASFSLAMLGLATPRLASDPRDRRQLWIGSLIPVAWASTLILWLTRSADATLAVAVTRSLAFLALYAPVALLFGGVVRFRRA